MIVQKFLAVFVIVIATPLFTYAESNGRSCLKGRFEPPCRGQDGSCYTNPDGSEGGFVADTASVGWSWKSLFLSKAKRRPFIGINAEVCDQSKVFGQVFVNDRARILKRSKVTDGAKIYDDAVIDDDAQVKKATIREHAIVFGGAKISGGATIQGQSRIFGNAKIKRALVEGIVYDHAYIDKNVTIGPKDFALQDAVLTYDVLLDRIGTRISTPDFTVYFGTEGARQTALNEVYRYIESKTIFGSSGEALLLGNPELASRIRLKSPTAAEKRRIRQELIESLQKQMNSLERGLDKDQDLIQRFAELLQELSKLD